MDIKNAGRTLDFFETFAADLRPLRLTELAKLLDAPASSCHQLVRTLERRGYVYALPGKTFYPTKRMLHNAERIASKDPVLSILRPELEALRDQTSESIILGQQVDHHAMILEVFESPHSVRYTARPGELRALHSSSIGKAILGALSYEERDLWLPDEPYSSLTSDTLNTRRALESDLARSQKRGWYASLGESVPELHAVSAPMRFAGRTFAVSVAGPITRFAPKQADHIEALLQTVRRVEALATQPET